MNSGDRVANIVAAFVIAFVAVLMITASYTPGFREMCAAGAPKVFARLKNVESYVVESPVHCVSFCMPELRRRDVAFLEYEATDENRKWLKGSYGRDRPWLPEKPGKYAFRIRNDIATCAQLMLDPEFSVPIERIDACVVVEAREVFASRVAYKVTHRQTPYRRGTLATTIEELSDRTTGKTLARRIHYYYSGEFALLPIAIEESCPDHGFLSINDIKK